MTDQTFLFYDLETSGINPRQSRIMQFAGQRTTLDFKPVGEPFNFLIKLSDDVLPDPDAILITGISPQKTIAEGISESEFTEIFNTKISTPGTIFVGFNNLRFDDEFIRFINYRNYYDAYNWQWQDGRSRWDILDMVRMTRALRPDGIEWPFAPDGRPANRLEYLTQVNKLEHSNAHDALADVKATIAVAELIAKNQPELFKYLLNLRDKREVAKLVSNNEALVYTSGRYPSSDLHTTVVYPVASHADQDAAIVFDLRFDPTPFLAMTAQELASIWRYNRDPEAQKLPAKTVKFNRCPAIAPLGVIKDDETQKRINIDLAMVSKNLRIIKDNQAEFADKLLAAAASLDQERLATQMALVDNRYNVDERLYDRFISDRDKALANTFRKLAPEQLIVEADRFSDDRLKSLALLYKARNFPTKLSTEEAQEWENFRRYNLFHNAENSPVAKFFNRLEELQSLTKDKSKLFLLEELKLYGESILPSE